MDWTTCNRTATRAVQTMPYPVTASPLARHCDTLRIQTLLLDRKGRDGCEVARGHAAVRPAVVRPCCGRLPRLQHTSLCLLGAPHLLVAARQAQVPLHTALIAAKGTQRYGAGVSGRAGGRAVLSWKAARRKGAHLTEEQNMQKTSRQSSHCRVQVSQTPRLQYEQLLR